jgi:hypothetical protein
MRGRHTSFSVMTPTMTVWSLESLSMSRYLCRGLGTEGHDQSYSMAYSPRVHIDIMRPD